MVGDTSWLMGSASRDQFKFLHKKLLDNNFYALDSDLELVSKYPVPFIVARLDFKMKPDSVSFTEAIAYNQLVNMPMPYYIPVFIVETEAGFLCNSDKRTEIIKNSKHHKFTVYKYIQADWRPEPPIVEKSIMIEGGWDILRSWEYVMRDQRCRQMENYLKLKKESK